MSEEQAESFDVLADQGLEDVSEAMLMGEDVDDPKDDDTKDDDTKDDDTKDDDTKDDDTKDDDTKDDDTKDEEESQGVKSEAPAPKDAPPKGFVPLAALHEVRGENRYLKEQMESMRASIESLKTAKPKEETESTPEDDFKVLTDEEFDELSEEDPKEAIRYMRQLRAHEKIEEEKEYQQYVAEQKEEEAQQIFSQAKALMEETIPGLFDKETGLQAKLAADAEEIGFSDELFYLTNPQTQVILPGAKEPTYLGVQAAKILKVVANAAKVKPGKEVNEAELRKTIEAEIMAKIKKGGSFKSLSDVPKAAQDKFNRGDNLTEAEFAKLTDAEQEAYLSGQ